MPRTRICLGLAVVAAVAMALPSHAQGEGVRSGRILGGASWPRAFGEEPPVGGSGSLGACHLAPDCTAWLQSMCAPPVAGREPALFSSIVDVAGIADGRTERTLELRAAGGQGLRWGEAVVQFWRSDCTEIDHSRWRPNKEACCGFNRARTVVPTSARWMTVVLSNDNVNVAWSLR